MHRTPRIFDLRLETCARCGVNNDVEHYGNPIEAKRHFLSHCILSFLESFAATVQLQKILRTRRSLPVFVFIHSFVPDTHQETLEPHSHIAHNHRICPTMRFSVPIILAALLAQSSSAFVPSQNVRSATTTELMMASDDHKPFFHKSWDQMARQTLTTAFVAASLWSAPAFMPNSNPVFPTSTAVAKEMASGTGSRVNKDPESLLRYGLPINNKEVRRSCCCFRRIISSTI